MQPSPVTVVGAGLAGSLLGTILARRGFTPTLYERRPDMRREQISAGRSINLALADRGIHALERAGVLDIVRPLMIPMRGRCIHDLDGSTTLQPYGQNDREVIYSVSRRDLNRLLMTEYERRSATTIHFRHHCRTLDFTSSTLTLQDEAAHRTVAVQANPVLAADGAGSALRDALLSAKLANASEDVLPHQYKELAIPPGPGGTYLLDWNALHIWPRGGFMLIALPNTDGSFTVTLFLPAKGPESFDSLTDAAAVHAFFSQRFPDVVPLIPELAHDFFTNPTGNMVTVHCSPWHAVGKALLLGDAAHAIVPFHGQGMNCAFEDCVVFDELLDQHHDWAELFAAFELRRQPDTAAIATMALENYVEMRDSVRSPRFQHQKVLALELERRFPLRFVPRYSMVMFHHEIGYARALARGKVQQQILDRLTPEVPAHSCDLADVDWPLAERLIMTQLEPLR
jgi:kynurenine 3-monooxygenase